MNHFRLISRLGRHAEYDGILCCDEAGKPSQTFTYKSKERGRRSSGVQELLI
jgi:hypothetical protein